MINLNSNFFSNHSGNGFIISEYQEYLTPSELPSRRKEKKFICPNCGEHHLSINADGKKYDCYSCGDRSAIAKKLIQLKKEATLTEGKFKKPSQKREWVYLDKNNQPHIKVIRVDDGKGKKKIYQQSYVNGKWQKGFGKNISQSNCQLLYAEEIKKAIDNNKLIFIVEGESCVDALRELGFTATTNIGGSGKNIKAYEVLKDYPNLVLFPDRDTVGVKHMETIEKRLNHQPRWFYTPSRLWNKLDSSGGIDIEDFINEKKAEKLTNEKIKELVMSLIGDKNEFSTEKESKIIEFPQPKILDKEGVYLALKELINQDISPAKLRLKFNEISQNSGIHVIEIEKVYKSLVQENDQQDNNCFLQSEINSITQVHENDINLGDYIPQEFVNPVNFYSQVVGSNSISMVTSLLPIIASLTNPNSELTLIESTEFKAKPIFFSAVVGESGTAKSPTIDLFTNGLFSLQNQANQKYERQKQEYEEYQGEEKIPEPQPTEYYVSDFTSEFIASLINRQPNKGFTILMDELASLIKQSNAYRGGKGSDTEKILSARDGRGIKVNRKNGDRYDTQRSSYSIVGGIQPDILRKQMGSCQDESGYWARFCYSYLPVKEAIFPDDVPKINLKPMLLNTYEKIEQLPELKLKLCPQGSKLYGDFFREMEKLKVNEADGAMRAVYSKYKRVAGEISLLLYVFHLAFYQSVDGGVDGVDISVNRYLPVEFMQKGINLAKRYIQEVKSIYLQNQGIVDGSLSPAYVKLIELSKRKGWIKAKDAKRATRVLKTTSTNDIRQLFKDITSMGYGQLKGKGNTLEWNYTRVDGVDGGLTGGSTLCQPPKNIDITELENLANSRVDGLTPKTNFSHPSSVQNENQENTKINISSDFQDEDNISSSVKSNSDKEKIKNNMSTRQPLDNNEPQNYTPSDFELVDANVNPPSTPDEQKNAQSHTPSTVDTNVNPPSTPDELTSTLDDDFWDEENVSNLDSNVNNDSTISSVDNISSENEGIDFSQLMSEISELLTQKLNLSEKDARKDWILNYFYQQLGEELSFKELYLDSKYDLLWINLLQTLRMSEGKK